MILELIKTIIILYFNLNYANKNSYFKEIGNIIYLIKALINFNSYKSNSKCSNFSNLLLARKNLPKESHGEIQIVETDFSMWKFIKWNRFSGCDS